MRRITRRGNGARKAMYGIGNLDSDVYMATTNPSGAAGADSGFYVAMVIRLVATYDLVSFAFSGGAARWLFRKVSNQLVFGCAGADTALVYSPGYSASLGAVYGIVGVHDGSNVRLYVNGAQAGSGTAITGFTNDGNTMYVGAGGGTPNGEIDYFGTAYGVGVPSAGDISTWWTRTVASRRIADMPTVAATRLWTPTATLSDIADSVGGVVLQRGSPQNQVLVTERSPVWG